VIAKGSGMDSTAKQAVNGRGDEERPAGAPLLYSDAKVLDEFRQRVFRDYFISVLQSLCGG
jgi:hypothetical protein